MIFATYYILRGRDTPIDFLRLLFLMVSGRCDLPSDARTFIAAKKADQSSARRRDVKELRRPFYKRLFK